MIERIKLSDPYSQTILVDKLNEIIDTVNVLLQAARPKTLNEAGEVVPAKDQTP